MERVIDYNKDEFGSCIYSSFPLGSDSIPCIKTVIDDYLQSMEKIEYHGLPVPDKDKGHGLDHERQRLCQMLVEEIGAVRKMSDEEADWTYDIVGGNMDTKVSSVPRLIDKQYLLYTLPRARPIHGPALRAYLQRLPGETRASPRMAHYPGEGHIPVRTSVSDRKLPFWEALDKKCGLRPRMIDFVALGDGDVPSVGTLDIYLDHLNSGGPTGSVACVDVEILVTCRGTV
ncbi:hypothetical protein K504DRAFT_455574 [Pleomassaria siparia CBS 279.74]|uniref:Uncharacterized protein n=1 Tax=Pleomassaria siparia CBS 279.74 TaxID=1314801 RepID=A0A6G1K722_9PLEO|nr:hypothetical protein K504DRAFT_455574 [Pleomassaria siparia CBS 279.74]